MKSLQIFNGDLVLSSSSRASFVYGKQKLAQDLRLWLQEPYGSSSTTQSFGTILLRLLGVNDTSQQQVRVEAEIQRVLGLYQANQLERLKKAKATGTLASWSKSEILNTIDKVSSIINQDSISVTILVTSMSGLTSSLNVLVSDTGVQVV